MPAEQKKTSRGRRGSKRKAATTKSKGAAKRRKLTVEDEQSQDERKTIRQPGVQSAAPIDYKNEYDAMSADQKAQNVPVAPPPANSAWINNDLPPLPDVPDSLSEMTDDSSQVTEMDTTVSVTSTAATSAEPPKQEKPIAAEDVPMEGEQGSEADAAEPEYRRVRSSPTESFDDSVEDDVVVYYSAGQQVFYWQDDQWNRSSNDHSWFLKWPLATHGQVRATGPVSTITEDDASGGLDAVDEERKGEPSDVVPPPRRRRWKRRRMTADEVAEDASAFSKSAAEDAAAFKSAADEAELAGAPLNSSEAETAAWRESLSVDTEEMDEEEYQEYLQQNGGTEQEQMERSFHRLAQKTNVQEVLDYAQLLEKEKQGETLSRKEMKRLLRMKAMRDGNLDDDARYATEVMEKAMKAWRKRAEITWGYFIDYVVNIAEGGMDECFDAQGPTVKAIKAFLVYARRRHPDGRYRKKKARIGLKMSTINGWKNHLSSCIKDRMEGAVNHKPHPRWRNRALSRSISKWIKEEWMEGLREGTDRPKQAIALTEEQLALLSKNMETVLGRIIGIKTRAILLTMLHCLYRYQDIKLVQWDGLDVKMHPVTKEEMWCLLVEEPTKADEERKVRWITDSYASYWTCAATHIGRWLEVSPTQLGCMFPQEGNCWEPIPYTTLLARIRRVAQATPGLEDFVDNMTLHMPRRSGAQIYLTRGGTLEHLMIAGGWRSMAVKRYIKGAMSGGLFSVSCVLSGSEAAVPKSRGDYAKYQAKMARMHKDISLEQGRAVKAEAHIEKLNRKHEGVVQAASKREEELLSQLRNLRLKVVSLENRLS